MTHSTSDTSSAREFDSLWDYSDPSATEARFREMLPNLESTPDVQTELLTQIARAQGLQRKFDQAHKTLDEAEKRSPGAETVAMVRILLERGRVYNSSGDPARSKEFFENALELAQKIGADFHAVDAAHMLGIVTKPEDALAWNRRALELALESSDGRARKWVGSLTNNIGWTYHGMGHYERALDYFQRNVEWHQSQLDPEKGTSKGYQIAQWCVARTLRSLGRTHDALDMQHELLKAAAESNRADTGYIHEEIAECLLALDRSDESRKHFARAYELLSEDIWLKANETERLERLRELGAG